MGYNKVVCATTGKVVNGILYLRSFTGVEQDVLTGLYSKFQTSKWVAGFNIIGYDLPIARVNSLQYAGVSELIPELHNDSGKKPWGLEKSVIELMDVFKGTHYANPSLDEVCHHLGIDSPKDGLDGSQVSETYYNEGVVPIETYCKKDVFSTVNVFCKLQGKPIFETYVDANEMSSPETKEIPLLERLYNTNSFSAEIKEGLEKLLKKKKITAKDKEGIKKIILGVYIRNDFERNDMDSKKVIEQKTQEVNNFVDKL